MTAGGPPWEGDPWAAQAAYEQQPTTPLPLQDPAGYYRAAPSRFAPPQARRRGRRLLRRLVRTVMVLVTLAVLGFGALLLITPSVSNAPTLAQAFDQAHRVSYPGPPVPARFAESLVATEDHRFYSEPGIDLYAVARVAAASLVGKGSEQGGATLYQQLAKMLYTPQRSGPRAEAEQVVLGIKLNFGFSKPQILQMYSAVAYFGHGYYGLAAASCGYFGTAPAGLTWPEAATLAGLVQGPSSDDPILHYAAARTREQHVLSRLVSTGKITESQAAVAYAQRLPLVGGSGRGCTAR